MGRYSNIRGEDKVRADVGDDPWMQVYVPKPIGNSNCFHKSEDCVQLIHRKSKDHETKPINLGAVQASGRVPCLTCFGSGTK